MTPSATYKPASPNSRPITSQCVIPLDSLHGPRYNESHTDFPVTYTPRTHCPKELCATRLVPTGDPEWLWCPSCGETHTAQIAIPQPKKRRMSTPIRECDLVKTCVVCEEQFTVDKSNRAQETCCKRCGSIYVYYKKRGRWEDVTKEELLERYKIGKAPELVMQSLEPISAPIHAPMVVPVSVLTNEPASTHEERCAIELERWNRLKTQCEEGDVSSARVARMRGIDRRIKQLRKMVGM
jgi:hypothetical protein